LNRQRTYNMQPLNEGFSIRSDCAIHQRASEQYTAVQLSKEVETQSSSSVKQFGQDTVSWDWTQARVGQDPRLKRTAVIRGD
jgi:hypothetical protein